MRYTALNYQKALDQIMEKLNDIEDLLDDWMTKGEWSQTWRMSISGFFVHRWRSGSFVGNSSS